MTGYQEIMTDPSYAGQIVTFTFPHIGNTGVNAEDDETAEPVAAGMVVKWDPTEPSNWRATGELTDWLARRGRIGIGGIDTRRLTRAIRQQGAPHAALAHDPEGNFDIEALVAAARAFPGLVGLDLAKDVTCAQSYRWDEMRWAWPQGYQRRAGPGPPRRRHRLRRQAQHPALPGQRRLRRHRAAGHAPPPTRCWRWTRRACSCRTAPAIRPRPAPMRCR